MAIFFPLFLVFEFHTINYDYIHTSLFPPLCPFFNPQSPPLTHIDNTPQKYPEVCFYSKLYQVKNQD